MEGMVLTKKGVKDFFFLRQTCNYLYIITKKTMVHI